jgi:hypothetical protein
MRNVDDSLSGPRHSRTRRLAQDFVATGRRRDCPAFFGFSDPVSGLRNNPRRDFRDHLCSVLSIAVRLDPKTSYRSIGPQRCRHRVGHVQQRRHWRLAGRGVYVRPTHRSRDLSRNHDCLPDRFGYDHDATALGRWFGHMGHRHRCGYGIPVAGLRRLAGRASVPQHFAVFIPTLCRYVAIGAIPARPDTRIYKDLV